MSGNPIYDLIVVGAGPAGITASVYAARKKMNFLIVTRDVGGQAALSGDIKNYTGYQFITGPELTQKFKEHLEQFKVAMKEGEKTTLVKKEGDIIRVETDKGKYGARSVIVASGRIPRKLGVPGEDSFRNKGVTYCATCDAPLFADMDVAVVGGGNSALDATLQLMKIAKKIYLIDAAPELRADPVMTGKARSSEKVRIYSNSKVTEISGKKFLRGIKVDRGDAVENIAIEGMFVEIGSLPASGFVEDVKKNQSGEILVNCGCVTNIPGIFAAGDVTDVPEKQIIVACGEGAKASLSAFAYLNRKKTDQVGT